MLDELFTTMRDHLSQQETKLPAIFRDKWGAISPPQLVTRSLAAAKRAQAVARAGAEATTCSRGWCTTSACATRRGPKFFVAALPFGKRIRSRSCRPRRTPGTHGHGAMACAVAPTHPTSSPLHIAGTRAPRLPQLDRPRRAASAPDAADRRALRASIVAGSTSRNLAAAAAEGEEGRDQSGTTRVQRPSIERGESQLSHPPRATPPRLTSPPRRLSRYPRHPQRCSPLARAAPPGPAAHPPLPWPPRRRPRRQLDYARAAGERREQQRRAGAVSAVLAAANARRDIASAQAGDADLTRMLAESREPAYRHGHEGGREHHEEIAKTWFGQGMRMNSGIYRKIGMQNPGDTRRV